MGAMVEVWWGGDGESCGFGEAGAGAGEGGAAVKKVPPWQEVEGAALRRVAPAAAGAARGARGGGGCGVPVGKTGSRRLATARGSHERLSAAEQAATRAGRTAS